VDGKIVRKHSKIYQLRRGINGILSDIKLFLNIFGDHECKNIINWSNQR